MDLCVVFLTDDLYISMQVKCSCSYGGSFVNTSKPNERRPPSQTTPCFPKSVKGAMSPIEQNSKRTDVQLILRMDHLTTAFLN